jgi:20S proteasome alpha/beta subunit
VGAAARRLADQQQVLTQQAGKGRLLASMVLMISAYELWRVDPTGQFWQCQAAAIGKKAATVEQLLLDRLSRRKHHYHPKRRLWSLRKTKKNKGENSSDMLLTPAELHSLLSELSIEDALALSTQCITEALETKVMPGQTKLAQQTPAVRLRGLSIRKDGGSKEGNSQVQSYTHRDLTNLTSIEAT